MTTRTDDGGNPIIHMGTNDAGMVIREGGMIEVFVPRDGSNQAGGEAGMAIMALVHALQNAELRDEIYRNFLESAGEDPGDRIN